MSIIFVVTTSNPAIKPSTVFEWPTFQTNAELVSCSHPK